MKSKLILFLILLLGYWLVVYLFNSLHMPLPQSHAQFLFFPFMVFTIAFIVKPILKVPLKFILLVIVVGLVVTGFSYSSMRMNSKVIMFAPLMGDKLATKTVIVRNLFDKYFNDRKSISTSTVFTKIESLSDVHQIFDSPNKPKAIIWGDLKNLRITLQKGISSAKAGSYSKDAQWLGSFKDFTIVNEIAGFSTGTVPVESTVKLLSGALTDNIQDQYQSARIKGKWRTLSPKGYLYFKIANHYLVSAFSGKGYQFTEIDCAIKNYKLALGLVRASEHPELRRSIVNNLGISLFIRGKYDKSKKDLSKARKLLLSAMRTTKKKKSKLESVVIATNNVKIINRLQ